MGCQGKALIHPSPGEGDSSSTLTEIPFWSTLCMRLPGCASSSLISLHRCNQRVHNGSKEGIAKSHLCPEGLWTLLSQSHPCCPPHPQQPSLWCDPWGEEETQTNKQEAVKKKEQDKKKCLGLPQEGGWRRCGHELVKYSHSCHWFLMEALKALGKAEGW